MNLCLESFLRDTLGMRNTPYRSQEDTPTGREMDISGIMMLRCVYQRRKARPAGSWLANLGPVDNTPRGRAAGYCHLRSYVHGTLFAEKEEVRGHTQHHPGGGTGSVGRPVRQGAAAVADHVSRHHQLQAGATITRNPVHLQSGTKRNAFDSEEIEEERDLHELIQRALAGNKAKNGPPTGSTSRGSDRGARGVAADAPLVRNRLAVVRHGTSYYGWCRTVNTCWRSTARRS